jgi:hypothetical protein
MFGTQYTFGRRFGVFGEVGFGYARQTGSTTTALTGLARVANHANSIGTRTGVGVVLYF